MMSREFRSLGNSAAAKGVYLGLLLLVDDDLDSAGYGMVYGCQDGGRPVAYTSARALASDLRIDHRTVPGNLERLENAGLIRRAGMLIELVGFSDWYRLPAREGGPDRQRERDGQSTLVSSACDSADGLAHAFVREKDQACSGGARSYEPYFNINHQEIDAGSSSTTPAEAQRETDPKAGRPPSKPSSNPALAAFQTRWAETYGELPVLPAKKAGPAMSRLLKQAADGDLERFSELVDAYLSDDDPKLVAEAHPWNWFESRINKYRVATGPTKNGIVAVTEADLEAARRLDDVGGQEAAG